MRENTLNCSKTPDYANATMLKMVLYAPRNGLKISYLRHLRINFTILPYTLIAFCLLPPQSRKCRPGDSADGNDMLDGL